MADVDSGEDPWRRHLHAAVDYILDGPGSGDMDEWATQVLASLGHFIRACVARPRLRGGPDHGR